jgi:hypothetical protein
LPPDLAEEFECFWERYPVKRNQQQAKRAWFDARQRATAEAILDGVERAVQAAGWYQETTDGAIFEPPHPHRWLDGRRWEDEYLTRFGDPIEWVKEGADVEQAGDTEAVFEGGTSWKGDENS